MVNHLISTKNHFERFSEQFLVFMGDCVGLPIEYALSSEELFKYLCIIYHWKAN